MHRIKNILGKTVLLLCGIFFFFITDIDVCAVETEEEKGNYSVIIEDDAELLLPEEEIMLESVMQDIQLTVMLLSSQLVRMIILRKVI